ncbi:hypothetical protein JCM11491_002802 [Sporobolomyces phaffii]
MSWLSSLAHHAVFALPLDEGSTSSTRPLSTSLPPDPTATPSASGHRGSARPPPPRLESIFPPARATSTPTKHPRSTPTRTPVSSSRTPARPYGEPEPAAEEKLAAVGKARNDRMCLIRGGTELILAVGSELRICNLKHAKAKATSSGPDPEDVGDYKVLTPRGSEINFEISRVIVNQTNQLLAVIGQHSVRVVQLPRPGQTWSTSASRAVDVTVHEVGKFFHSLPGSSPVVDALWHPLGQHSSSLVVLTEDCSLREYTLHESNEEPSQTLSFSSDGGEPLDKKKKKKWTFSAEDERGQEATAMALGDCDGGAVTAANWGKMTVYALMKNGDVKSICPFLPKRSSIPRQYLEGLQSFVSTKLDALSAASAASPSLGRSSLPSLSRSTDHPDSSTSDPPTLASEVERDVVEKRYLVQLQYLQTLLRQLPPPSTGPADDHGDAVVDVIAPISRPNLKPSVQGPYLFAPATVELDAASGAAQDDDDDDEDEATLATDLCYLPPKAGGASVGVLMIVYRNGKLEVCLEVEKPEARFGVEDAQLGTALVVRRGGAGAESERDGGGGGGDLPMLWVHETLDLGWSAARGQGGWPTLRRDELYGDGTVWISSNLGVQCFVLDPRGFETLADQREDDAGGSQVYWAVKTAGLSGGPEDEDNQRPIVGLQVIDDVYLGYSLLAITPLLQLVGIELSLRIDDSAAPPAPASPPRAGGPTSTVAVDEAPAYTSLLETPFSLPAIFSNPKLRTKPTLADPGAASREVAVTPASLRQFGQVVESYQTMIRQVVEGADAVQHRLELQFRELSRQLDKLRDLRKVSGDLRTSTSGGSVDDAAGGGGGLVARLARVERTQVELLARLDSVLQRLIERHQGRDELSQFEQKWFKELERLERQVKGDKAGLQVKAQRVEAMWQELRGPVERLVEKKQQEPARGGATLGRTQIRGLESKLSEEAKLLADAKKKVERLTRSLASTSI